jgi:primosomal protein N' (replication factor Y) (superfamily II helicase)
MKAGAIEVAVPLPLQKAFSYLLPAELAGEAHPGLRVRVPFGPRQLIGFILGPSDMDPAKLKPISALVDSDPLLRAADLQLAQRIAQRWFCGVGEVLTAMLPAGVKRGARGRLTTVVHPVLPAAADALADWPSKASTKQRELLRSVLETPAGIPRQTLERNHQVSGSPLETLRKKGLVTFSREHRVEDVFAALEIECSQAPELTPQQRKATDAIAEALRERSARGFLLHGVTGSGKTEVYLDAIGRCLSEGRGAIVMVPEIALTPQTVERFESRFGTVAVLHSHLTDADRARQWRELREGRRRIAIGPRSAVFAPIRDLGLIVIDEEHENTFKQQNAPRYHAREVAQMRAELEGSVVILGSATPSLESWEAARRGDLTLISMRDRVGGGEMPPVSRIDMRSQRPTGPGGLFSPLLANLLRRNLERGEQSLLFLNRRGFRTALRCKDCGYIKRCRDCDVAMTWYRERDHLLCHHCGRSEPTPRQCSECRTGELIFRGVGTEFVESATRRLLPEARVRRIDSETTRGRGAHERLFTEIKRREVDIIIGTQMIAKGLDFPEITLIGVINADSSLGIPDFRAAERTFQLLTQVAGRAGRGARPGQVMVQTYTPEHYALETAARHDYEAFAEAELEYRRSAGYPPFGHLARAVLQGEDEAKVIAAAAKLRQELAPVALENGVGLLGPAPAPLSFIKRLHRHHLVMRCGRQEGLDRLLQRCADCFRSARGVQILVDVDPVAMM